VKLIRSKGVGVFFCTQLPTDVPNAVLSQLGARIQHALRAFTPEDQTALAKTVRTYPRTAHYDLESALTSLGTGEAIVTVLFERRARRPSRGRGCGRPARSWPRSAPRRSPRPRGARRGTRRYGATVDRESA
jgi:hypothetical protein